MKLCAVIPAYTPKATSMSGLHMLRQLFFTTRGPADPLQVQQKVTCLRAGKSLRTGAGCLGTLVSKGSSADFFEQIMKPICPLQLHCI